MADRAILDINFRARHVCRFIGCDGHGLRHLALDAGVERLVGQRFLQRHGMIGGRHGRAPGGKVEVHSHENQNDSHYNSKQERLHDLPSYAKSFCEHSQKTQIIILAVRRLLRILWMALVLLIVALASALISMRLAIHGREVKVPDFRNKTPVEARQMAEVAGMNVRIERQYYSASVAEGRVLSQTPDPGTTVRRDWDVRLALSLGPQRVTIPQVVGESQRAAAITIDQRGLDIGSSASAQLLGSAAGLVVGQDPPANAADVSSPKINLLVAQDAATEAYVMPSFIGQPLGSVSNTLKDAGFSVGKVTFSEPVAAPTVQATAPLVGAAIPSPAAIIVAQDPAQGQKILAGSAVNFTVR